jgi:hypothetical protein
VECIGLGPRYRARTAGRPTLRVPLEEIAHIKTDG